MPSQVGSPIPPVQPAPTHQQNSGTVLVPTVAPSLPATVPITPGTTITQETTPSAMPSIPATWTFPHP